MATESTRIVVRTRDKVAELLADGLSQNAVAAALGISKATVSYHARNLGRARDERCNRCEICGVTEWLERPLVMALHHINGDNTDNRLPNLQLLCPNCHSQTESFSGRNKNRNGAG